MTPREEELTRLLAESERRNGNLSALLRDVGGNEGAALLAKQARDTGMASWHEKFSPREDQTTQR